MKLINWKSLDRKELNTIKGFFASNKSQTTDQQVAIDYIDDFGREFLDNDFITSLIDQFFDKFQISDKQAFWLSVAYLSYKKQS